MPEGIEGRVPYKGTVQNIIYQLIGGIRSSMGYTGCATIDEMRSKAQYVRVPALGNDKGSADDSIVTTWQKTSFRRFSHRAPFRQKIRPAISDRCCSERTGACVRLAQAVFPC